LCGGQKKKLRAKATKKPRGKSAFLAKSELGGGEKYRVTIKNKQRERERVTEACDPKVRSELTRKRNSGVRARLRSRIPTCRTSERRPVSNKDLPERASDR